jgi:hypothetical protein
MAWQPPFINEVELHDRCTTAAQEIQVIQRDLASKGVQQINGIDEFSKLNIIFNMLEEMGWPRKLMDAMLLEELRGAYQKLSAQIEQQMRDAQLAAQAQGQEVRTQTGIVLPGAPIPPDIHQNGPRQTG